MDDSTGKDLHGFPTISHLLEWRVNRIPDQKAYVLLDSRGRESKVLTYKKFSQKAYAIAAFLRKKFAVGTHVVIMMTLSLEFMITIHACLYCGLIPIPIR
jgi:acyl-CoA synthetase (AMP-forming)/AMP-acid ligase II